MRKEMVRLAKFGKLVKNEYIKTLKRISTIVMLIIAIIAGIGLPVFAKVASKITNSYYIDPDYMTVGNSYGQYREVNPESDYTTEEEITCQRILFALDKLPDVKYTIDWRCIALEEIYYEMEVDLSEATNLYNSFVAENEDMYNNVDSDIKYGYLTEEQEIAYNKAVAAATVKALDALEASEEYKTMLDILSRNDLTAFYNAKIEQAKTTDALELGIQPGASKECSEAIKQSYIETLERLRDNEVLYLNGINKYDAELIDGYYDPRYYEEQTLLEAKITRSLYEIDGSVSKSEYESIISSVTLSEYLADNDISYNVYDNYSTMSDNGIDFWTSMKFSTAAVSFAGILAIIIAALSISNEFSNGTIKFLLINPVKRWKILMSKYFTVISSSYILIALLLVVSFITSTILFGGSLIGESAYRVIDNEVVKTSGILLLVKDYLVASVEVVVSATLAFAISSVSKSSAFSIGISLFSMLMGSTIVMFLSELKQDWARYLIFSNMDLASIAEGTSPFAYHSVGFAVGVIGIHMAIFILMAWDGFTKREV